MAHGHDRSSGGIPAPRLPSDHFFVFRLKNLSSGKWVYVSSSASIEGLERIDFQPDTSSTGALLLIAAALLVLRHRTIEGEEPVIDANEAQWEAELAKRVYQALQDAKKSKGNKLPCMHNAFGTTLIDKEKQPSIVRVIRAVGRKVVRFQGSVDAQKVRVECLVNGVPISEGQLRSLLSHVCGATVALVSNPQKNTEGTTALAAAARSMSIAGKWDCESTLLNRLPKLPRRKIVWGLELTLSPNNEVRGTSWYRSPAPGSNGREVSGSVRGDFNAEGGYLRLEWWVADSNALGFGHHLLRLRSNGREMEGFGIGHSSEGDGMFAVSLICRKRPVQEDYD